MINQIIDENTLFLVLCSVFSDVMLCIHFNLFVIFVFIMYLCAMLFMYLYAFYMYVSCVFINFKSVYTIYIQI